MDAQHQSSDDMVPLKTNLQDTPEQLTSYSGIVGNSHNAMWIVCRCSNFSCTTCPVSVERAGGKKHFYNSHIGQRWNLRSTFHWWFSRMTDWCLVFKTLQLLSLFLQFLRKRGRSWCRNNHVRRSQPTEAHAAWRINHCRYQWSFNHLCSTHLWIF